jgi:hypothetical protein
MPRLPALCLLSLSFGAFLGSGAVAAAEPPAAGPTAKTGAAQTGARRDATLIVAAHNASEQTKRSADYVCDGMGDQDEINAAVRALPAAGGRILLSEGTFDIRKVEGTLGGVLIERSDVVLAGQGTSTKLVQAAGQNTNVIRILGSGVGRITITDLWVDANRQNNAEGRGDPDISHDRFEYCGIKAFCAVPGKERGEDTHDITIRNCRVEEAHRLGIMLEGPNMKVVDNVLGNAGSDAVEILTGPGEIRGNYVEITEQTHVAIGSDRGNSIVMSDNIIHVKPEGRLDIGFRSWAGSRRHVISGNIVTVDPGGKCTLAIDIRGTGAAVTGNSVHGGDGEPTRLAITGGNTLLMGNLLENVVIEVDDATEENKPILVTGNVMENSRIDHKRGKLVTSQPAK